MNANIYNQLLSKNNIGLIAKNNTEVLYNNGENVLKDHVLKVELIHKIDNEYIYLFIDCLTVVSFDYLYKNFIPQII